MYLVLLFCTPHSSLHTTKIMICFRLRRLLLTTLRKEASIGNTELNTFVHCQSLFHLGRVLVYNIAQSSETKSNLLSLVLTCNVVVSTPKGDSDQMIVKFLGYYVSLSLCWSSQRFVTFFSNATGRKNYSPPLPKMCSSKIDECTRHLEDHVPFDWQLTALDILLPRCALVDVFIFVLPFWLLIWCCWLRWLMVPFPWRPLKKS